MAKYTPDESTEELPTEPVGSLHAIVGIHTEDTMQIHVSINGHDLLALLNTGSTQNFINEPLLIK